MKAIINDLTDPDTDVIILEDVGKVVYNYGRDELTVVSPDGTLTMDMDSYSVEFVA